MAKIDSDPNAVLTLEQHTQRLETGWRWLEAEWARLKRHPNRRDAAEKFAAWLEREDRWLEWEVAYKNHFNALQRGAVPHVQEAFL